MSHSQNPQTVGNYVLGKTIGKGTFGKVKLGVHSMTEQKVAIKILEKSRIKDVRDAKRVQREIKMLKTVQDPTICKLYEIINAPNAIYIVLEYAAGGELFNYIQ